MTSTCGSRRRTVAAALAAVMAGGAGAAPSARQSARPVGTLYTLAQLTPLEAQWRASPHSAQAMRASGRLYIEGVVARSPQGRYLLEYREGGWRAKRTVLVGIDLAPYVGRRVVVGGELDELPLSMFPLRRAELVADTSGLVRSNLPAEAGLVRASVSVEQVRASPGQGVPAKDLAAVWYHGEGHTTVNGYTFAEHVSYLLRDGTLYDRADTPPEDLDAAASRTAEPQHWHRWKAAGSGYAVLRTDARGEAKGDWRPLPGRAVRPWPRGQRLEGHYGTSRFDGSLALGGTYTRNGLIFQRDGRFESTRFAQSGSGSMAAQSGFVGSATSHSNASGTRGNVGAGGPDVAVTRQSARNDGAEHRGSYRLEGYVLELRYDSGRVERLLSFALGDDARELFVGSRSYRLASAR